MKNGPYELVKAPENYPGKKYRGKYCYKHHLVWWKKTGETIQRGEVIHHKNGNKIQNNFSNLEKHKHSEHMSIHAKARPVKIINIQCFWCAKPFAMFLRVFKSRKKVYGHENFCCSRSCQVKKQQAQLKTSKESTCRQSHPTTL